MIFVVACLSHFLFQLYQTSSMLLRLVCQCENVAMWEMFLKIVIYNNGQSFCLRNGWSIAESFMEYRDLMSQLWRQRGTVIDGRVHLRMCWPGRACGKEVRMEAWCARLAPYSCCCLGKIKFYCQNNAFSQTEHSSAGKWLDKVNINGFMVATFSWSCCAVLESIVTEQRDCIDFTNITGIDIAMI